MLLYRYLLYLVGNLHAKSGSWSKQKMMRKMVMKMKVKLEKMKVKDPIDLVSNSVEYCLH